MDIDVDGGSCLTLPAQRSPADLIENLERR